MTVLDWHGLPSPVASCPFSQSPRLQVTCPAHSQRVGLLLASHYFSRTLVVLWQDLFTFIVLCGHVDELLQSLLKAEMIYFLIAHNVV